MNSNHDDIPSTKIEHDKWTEFLSGKNAALKRLRRPGQKKLEIAFGKEGSGFYKNPDYRVGYMQGCALFGLDIGKENSRDYSLQLAGYAMGLDLKLLNKSIDSSDISIEKFKNLIAEKFDAKLYVEFNQLFEDTNLALLIDGFKTANTLPVNCKWHSNLNSFPLFSTQSSTPKLLSSMQIDFNQGKEIDKMMIEKLDRKFCL